MTTEINITTAMYVINGLEKKVEILHGYLHPCIETTKLLIDCNTQRIDLTHCFNIKEIEISEKSHSLIIYCDTDTQLQLIKSNNPENTIIYSDGRCNGPLQFYPMNIWDSKKIDSEYFLINQ